MNKIILIVSLIATTMARAEMDSTLSGEAYCLAGASWLDVSTEGKFNDEAGTKKITIKSERVANIYYGSGTVEIPQSEIKVDFDVFFENVESGNVLYLENKLFVKALIKNGNEIMTEEEFGSNDAYKGVISARKTIHSKEYLMINEERKKNGNNETIIEVAKRLFPGKNNILYMLTLNCSLREDLFK